LTLSNAFDTWNVRKCLLSFADFRRKQRNFNMLLIVYFASVSPGGGRESVLWHFGRLGLTSDMMSMILSITGIHNVKSSLCEDKKV
jgi:hypothetical protein